MKFAGIIALFVAAATAAPIVGEAINTVKDTLNDPAATVAQVEGIVSQAEAGAENAVNRILRGRDPGLGGAEKVFNDALGGAEKAVKGVVGKVATQAKPVTGIASGLAGGLLRN
ncbi:hypothetical protein ISF_05711 [Cordyceps fumosorosea ARSEF 2679]|uniref:Uncharacterized protein n=1 Tax=Cordyceps fumosorosea (strain ARSEF 2679) TaxID=1081104 RepID=A0A167TJT3_CORFA|nr:hypothetical protein ISF_05711 [Cordyceps fumosorosea ARSEF 2679]OAA60672.1 hypothetical protein ISF_05711 [Cordyceps fumosorosea ARSEF 2679]